MYCGKAVDLTGKLFTRVISPLSRLSAYKIWGMQFNAYILKFGVEWRDRKVCVFQWKTGHISETVRGRANVIISH